ncbi:MAG: hypothetical protein WEB30_15635, partial [Cyclobacteriaceae bacterium]
EASQRLEGMLRHQLPSIKIMGPGEPMIAKIRNQYLMNILLKMIRGKSDLNQIKLHIQDSTNMLSAEKTFRNVRFVVDVDPV